MKSKYPFFYNKESIELITEFEKGVSGKIKSRSSYLNNLENVDLKFENNEIILDYKKINKKTKKRIKWDDNRVFHNISLITPNYNLFIEKFYSWGWFTGFTSFIYSKGFKKDSKNYFKFIIPLKKEVTFRFQLEEFSFESDLKKWSRVASSIVSENEKFFLLQDNIQTKIKKKHYLIIESNKKQSYLEFIDKVFALRVAFGYITGNFIGGKAFVFYYNNKERKKFNGFICMSLRKDMKGFYQPINSNPYAWLYSKERKKVEAIRKEKNLRTLTKEEFSKLYSVCLKNDKFLSILLLMIETGRNSLLISPITYFTALEQLSNIIFIEKPTIPISDTKDADKLKNELLNIVDKFEKDNLEKDYDLSPIRKRIQNINQKTNNDKLISCFKKLDVELLKEDLKVIKSRNILMHGNFPSYRKKKNRSIKDKDLDLYYTSIRIYTLINILILKYIGYDNYVINFSKIYEKDTEYILKEDFYRRV
ncbi:hypothetical protein [Mesonia sp. K7]|uniref:hypothetical protein n=1 Tax=Mesonia sp. K7 TaxID=2218606 RepID=UPI000DA7E73A|nr:hypothetical protein [Mesonia sp. K7]PZD79160.1 hypothetical protein DNG35_03905 [Mesonia sp. K7]